MRARIHYERTAQHGELRPVTPASEIERNREALFQHIYRAPESAAIEALLKPAEKIISVAWYEITTDRQTILRRELPKVLRPVTFRDGDQWRRQFATDDQVAQAEYEEQRRQAPVANRFGQPSKWIE